MYNPLKIVFDYILVLIILSDLTNATNLEKHSKKETQ